MGLFDGIAELKTSDRGIPLTAGKYELEVQSVETFKSSQQDKEYFLTKWQVKASSSEQHPVGSERVWLMPTKLKHDMSLKNFKQFVLKGFGIVEVNGEFIYQDKKLTGSQFEELCVAVIQKNALKGQCVSVEVVDTKKKNGEPFTAYKF